MAGKDYRQLLAALKEQGWVLEGTSNSHIKAYPPDKSRQIVCFTTTSGDPRALKNTLRDLRASGFMWPALRDVTPCAPDFTMSPIYEPEEEPMSTEEPPQQYQEPVRTPDQLFSDLKEARTYAALAKEALRDSHKAFEEAKEALKGSEEEYGRAVEQMNLCKRRFDKAFNAEEM